ncbi:MAG: aldo/keto reductase [Anaerolineales bacterium]|nr:aldo/keto reductase [Anaerolineales bacterium]MCS7247097.1 aldo/keto reductase [Anaerolineales bacterium]MDW8160908.1 aldo/keto reductase [Anaerolineales bacterium]MDW8447060.1 aldo/keto reductase [Anaerolineales bacterium]
MKDYTNLGTISQKISWLGIGTWAWGDRRFWGYGTDYSLKDVEEAFFTTVSSGINFIDTAEVYGGGLSEKIIASLMEKVQTPLVIATKFFPFPWRVRAKDFRKALLNSLKRLRLERVHLYQIHWPFPPVPIEKWVSCLADAYEEGLVEAVGVSNYNADQLQRAHDVLVRRNIPLTSNQVPYSLINRKIEQNGVFRVCQERKIQIIAYSPIGQGLLTGKYSEQRPPSGVRRFLYSKQLLRKIQPLQEKLKEIGEAHGGKTPAQVALNWVICKGAIPIPGAKNARQAEENAGALNWRLTPEEVSALDQLSSHLTSS